MNYKINEITLENNDLEFKTSLFNHYDDLASSEGLSSKNLDYSDEEVSEQDKRIIIEYYNRKVQYYNKRRKKRIIEDLDGKGFFESIIGRMEKESFYGLCPKTKFNSLVNRETSNAVKRSKNKFLEDIYQKKREQVLKAVSRRALELFMEWRDIKPPRGSDDKRNLDCSLVKYLWRNPVKRNYRAYYQNYYSEWGTALPVYPIRKI